MKRHYFLKISFILLASALFGIGAYAQNSSAKVIRVGTVSGPDAQVWEVVQRVAAKKGLNVKIIEFNDYVQPNAALDAGDLDANSFQHQPYLDSQVKQRGYQIVSVAKTYIAPMGVYSKKLKSLQDLPSRGTVAVPNDPSNETRALLLLQAQGVIKLRPSTKEGGQTMTALDVTENSKKLKFRELDAAQLPRALDDVDAAVINTNYALAAGLRPTMQAQDKQKSSKDALVLEALGSPYANVIAVRRQDKDQPWVKKLVDSYHSPEVKQFIDKNFKGAMFPSF